MSNFLATYLLHSTVILGLTLLALRAPAFRAPGLRDLALRAALIAGLVTSGLAPLHLPSRVLTVPELPGAVLSGSPSSGPDLRRTRPADPPLQRIEQSITGPGVDWGALLILGSAGFAAIRFGVAGIQLRRARAGRVQDADLLHGPHALTPGVTLAWTGLPVPCAVGTRHILLPHDIQQRLDAAQLGAVLAHECAHLRRRDPLWNLALSFLTQVLWFQPLNWLALRAWRDATEELCDAWAARHVSRLSLAQALLTLTRDLRPVPTVLISQAARTSHLSQRIHALLDPQEPHMNRSHALVLIALPALLGSVLPPLALAGAAGRTVVVDAGHGWSEPGAVGVGQAVEADITQALALQVRARLERQGVSVILTRPPTPRAALSKPQELEARLARVPATADAFVSIHTNFSSLPADQGVSTYFANDGAAEVVLAASRALAGNVHSALVAATGARSMAIGGADFYVLRKSRVLAVLVEVGFLSNPTEARALQDAAYQGRVADGIVRGILAQR